MHSRDILFINLWRKRDLLLVSHPQLYLHSYSVRNLNFVSLKRPNVLSRIGEGKRVIGREWESALRRGDEKSVEATFIGKLRPVAFGTGWLMPARRRMYVLASPAECIAAGSFRQSFLMPGNFSFGTLLFGVESLELIARKRPASVSEGRGTVQFVISVECFRSRKFLQKFSQDTLRVIVSSSCVNISRKNRFAPCLDY